MRVFEICQILQNNPYEKIEILNQNDLEDSEISALNALSNAKFDEMSYCDGEKNLKNLQDTKAKFVLISPKFSENFDKKRSIIVQNPHLAFAVLSEKFAKNLIATEGESEISALAKIMPNAYIGKSVKIGENSIIMPGVFIGDNVKIGKDCIIHPNVVIYNDSVIGDGCHLQANSVIGSDGFGYAHTRDGKHVKIYHNGNVILGDFVEVGACSTIDRGVFEPTIIESYTKLDNLVQIGHNCKVGFGTIIVSQAGLAGSTTLGRNVVLGGQSGTAGHLKVGDFAQFAARSGISKSLEGGKKYGGHPAIELKEWFKFQAKLNKITKDKNDK